MYCTKCEQYVLEKIHMTRTTYTDPDGWDIVGVMVMVEN